MKRDEKKLMDALYKKAVGYTTEECSEEFSLTDGTLALAKRRIKRMHIPPDVSAAKLYLSLSGMEDAVLAGMSEAELIDERRRLLKELESEE